MYINVIYLYRKVGWYDGVRATKSIKPLDRAGYNEFSPAIAKQISGADQISGQQQHQSSINRNLGPLFNAELDDEDITMNVYQDTTTGTFSTTPQTIYADKTNYEPSTSLNHKGRQYSTNKVRLAVENR